MTGQLECSRQTRKTLPEASRTHQSTGLQASRTQPPYSMTVQTDNSNAKNTPFTNRNTRLEASPGIYITQRTMIGSMCASWCAHPGIPDDKTKFQTSLAPHMVSDKLLLIITYYRGRE